MRLWLPRTMTGLVTAGCLLAAVPLLVALVWAGTELDRFSTRSERLANEGVTITRLGTELREDVERIERGVRQYAVLGDAALVVVVNSRLTEVQTTLDAIAGLGIEPLVDSALPSARGALQRVQSAWRLGIERGERDAVLIDISRLDQQSQGLVALGRDHLNAQLKKLRSSARDAQRAILISVLALVPLTGGLAYGFSLAITRPLRQMNYGIAALGYARYQKPIVIAYPQEMQRLGRRLDWLRQRLSALELDKDRFLRHVSHELKTPLASLQEGSSLMLEGRLGALTAKQEEVTKILVESTAELSHLIDNLLAYSEWRSGRRHAEMVWFDAASLIEEVCAAQKLMLERMDLNVTTYLSVGRMYGQRSRLKIALENLFSNALKHAPRHSSIEMCVGIAQGICELSVRDHGKGVPEGEREQIFEAFVRGTEAEESGIRGTGVGLSIVRETALAHDGMVEVTDANPGARFTMRWPCANQDHDQPRLQDADETDDAMQRISANDAPLGEPDSRGATPAAQDLVEPARQQARS